MTRTGRYKIFPILGAATVIVALFLLSRHQVDSPYWYVGLSLYIMGMGLGLTMQVLMTVVQNAVDRKDMGVATSAVTFFRQMGGSFGTALFGAILTSRLAVHIADGMQALPARAQASAGSGKVDKLANDVQAIDALPEPLHGIVTAAFSGALSDVFLTAVPLVVVALAAAFFIKELPLASRQPSAGGDSPSEADESVSGSSPISV
jgi:hypothetical protein